jgi:hypothetical protein
LHKFGTTAKRRIYLEKLHLQAKAPALAGKFVTLADERNVLCDWARGILEECR